MGKVAVIIAMAIALLFILKNDKRLLIGYIAVIAMFLLSCFLIPQIRSRIVSHLFPYDVTTEYTPWVSNIVTKEDEVQFTAGGTTYHLSYYFEDEWIPEGLIKDKLQLSFKNDDGVEFGGVFHRYDGNPQYYEFPSFANGDLIVEEQEYNEKRVVLVRSETHPDLQLIFCNEIDDSGYYWANKVGKFVKMPFHFEETHLFPNNLFGRGRIWNKTIPLLPKHILLGSGGATFITEYPQEQSYLGDQTGEYVSKPHNLYLQYWVEEGLIFLILFIAFFGIYIVQSANILWKAGTDHTSVGFIGPMAILRSWKAEERFCLGLFTGILVFLLAGFATDSMVVYSPIVWTLIGVGYGVNYNIKHLI